MDGSSSRCSRALAEERSLSYRVSSSTKHSPPVCHKQPVRGCCFPATLGSNLSQYPTEDFAIFFLLKTRNFQHSVLIHHLQLPHTPNTKGLTSSLLPCGIFVPYITFPENAWVMVQHTWFNNWHGTRPRLGDVQWLFRYRDFLADVPWGTRNSWCRSYFRSVL